MRPLLLMLAAIAVLLPGCGDGGDETVTSSGRTVTVTTTETAPDTTRTTTEPAEPDADRYARRTYVVQEELGRRTFEVNGSPVVATTAEGTRISAYPILLADSGDGTGQAVLLFRDGDFLGWASDRLAIRLALGLDEGAITVTYGNFQGDDPFCCPSSKKTVRYSWNGERIVADGDPPLSYGRPGDRLRLAPDG